MTNITLAFLWHFHQPLYQDLPTGKLLMPWPRLHGVKDYIGMARLLEEYPDIRCTANFSPALLVQIEALCERKTDTLQDLCRRDPGSLTGDEREKLLTNLFYAHPNSVIGGFPRFRALHEQRQRRAPFSAGDLLDLQAVANLAWFHGSLFEGDAELQALRAKGRNFTAAERNRILDKQIEILRLVLPAWKALQGRVEISVSPYYHPIVPLLCSFENARPGLPDRRLPEPKAGLVDDARVHCRRAIDCAERIFGTRPRGVWPSEGSVSEDACRLFAESGFAWGATDEEVLHASTDAPDIRVPWQVGDFTLMFRDKELSNLVSFTYKTWAPENAAKDFCDRVEASPDGSLVAVVLDGENPWEHYTAGGSDFLRALYSEIAARPRIRTATMSESAALPSRRLEKLWPGSWINHNFGVWVGHEEDVAAWNLLGRVRDDLARTADARPLAWECLYAAEGSDWFWWFGEDFSTPQDAEFDALFRRHLANVYRVNGKTEPPELMRPIKRAMTRSLMRPPWAMLSVVLDGRRTDYFEWIAAGHYDLAREYGALSGELAFLSDLFFGYDESNLLLRLDFKPGVEPRRKLEGAVLRLIVTRPSPRTIDLFGPDARYAVDEILEVAVPFEKIGAAAGDDLEFYLEYEETGGHPARVPTILPLSFKVPSGDAEKIDWQV